MTQDQIMKLISSMTLEEKAAQMTQLAPVNFGFNCVTPLTGPDSGLRIRPEFSASIGSVLNCGSAEDMIRIQKEHLENDPHKIPLLFMADVVHGFKTVFPIPLAVGCSFSPENAREAAQIAAEESSVSGIHVTFAPMADLVRDPRWGRVMESFGEDPLLNSRMCAAAVKGYQGSKLSSPYRTASCVKHFAAYGSPEGGREYNTVDLSDNELYNSYLPAYTAALEAGARMVMTAFNTVDLIPATASEKLINDILRKERHFNGPVISDYNSVGELIEHGAAENGYEAACKSLKAGVDIEMMSSHFCAHLRELVNNGQITEQMIDKAVLRILNLKNELGLFENPFKDASREAEASIHLSEKNREAARRIARESAVLLKNNGVLPVSFSGAPEKIGLTGPFASSPYILGGWSAGNQTGIPLYEGLCGRIPRECIRLEDCGQIGSCLEGNPDIPAPDASFYARFKDCGTVIVAAGEHQEDTGEGGSKAFLRLSPNQEKLIQQMSHSGKRVILILFSGRPLEIAPIEPYCDAILQAWFPGTESGNALAELITGAYNPSGRLSISFPYTVGQIPVYYNHYQTGRPKRQESTDTRYVSRYLDCPNEPLYCFGYGLSYSEFHYSNLQIRNSSHSLTASVTVTNVSDITGCETVQFYIRDLSASLVRPAAELKDFSKVHLTGGESKTVSFTITKEMLSFYKDGRKIFEDGYFLIMIGKNSAVTLKQKLYITEQQFKKETL